MNRRDFLKLGGIAAASAAVLGAAAPAPALSEPEVIVSPSPATKEIAWSPDGCDLDAVAVLRRLLHFGDLFSRVPRKNVQAMECPRLAIHEIDARSPSRIVWSSRTFELMPIDISGGISRQQVQDLTDQRGPWGPETLLYHYLAHDLERAAIWPTSDVWLMMADDLRLRATRAWSSSYDDLLDAGHAPRVTTAPLRVIGTPNHHFYNKWRAVPLCHMEALPENTGLFIDPGDIYIRVAPTTKRAIWWAGAGNLELGVSLQMKLNIFLGHPHDAVVGGWPPRGGRA